MTPMTPKWHDTERQVEQRSQWVVLWDGTASRPMGRLLAAEEEPVRRQPKPKGAYEPRPGQSVFGGRA